MQNELAEAIAERDFEASRFAGKGKRGDMQLARNDEQIRLIEEEIGIVNASIIELSNAQIERQKKLEAIKSGVDPLPGIDTGGGSGGGGDSSLSGLERLRESLATQTETVQMWHEEQLANLREYRDRKLITEQEYNDLERQINERHTESLRQIEQRSMQTKLSSVKGALGNISALMQTENEKLFKVGKAASLANAIVNGHEAAAAAWTKGMASGGPLVAAAFTAASLAKTGALISSIQSANSRGTSAGAVGGGGVVAPSAPAPAEPTVSRNIAIQLQGEVFNAAQVRSLINQINEQVEDGAVIRIV